MPNLGVILVAAGKSSRFGDANYKKPFAPLAGRSVWLHAAEKFLDHDDVKQVVIVIAPEDREYFMDKFGADIAFLGIKVADGGKHRSDSVSSGFTALKKEIEFVAIHDAARPCLASRWIDDVFKTAVKTGAAISATPDGNLASHIQALEKISFLEINSLTIFFFSSVVNCFLQIVFLLLINIFIC